jgi:hypothetical protein
VTGQFVIRDPAVSVTWSPYGYVRGNPLNATDTAGLSPAGGEGDDGGNVAPDMFAEEIILAVEDGPLMAEQEAAAAADAVAVEQQQAQLAAESENVTFCEAKLPHVFRNAPGQLTADSPRIAQSSSERCGQRALLGRTGSATIGSKLGHRKAHNRGPKSAVDR